MAFLITDWTIDYVAKTVTNNDSGTGNNIPFTLGTYAKVGPILEFFQWLAAEFAISGQMDDTYPIESQTPTVFKWLNGWTFGHADDFKYLNGGSIEDPLGSGTATADSLWANLYSIGSQEVGTQLYMAQNSTVVAAPWWISGNIDILVLVKNTGVWVQSDDTSGTPTDGGLWIYAREMGDTFDHGFADISGGGRNPIGINTSPDSSNKSGDLYVTVGAAEAATFTVGSFIKGGTSGAVGRIAKLDTGLERVYINAARGGTFVAEALTEATDREFQVADAGAGTSVSATDVTAGRSARCRERVDIANARRLLIRRMQRAESVPHLAISAGFMGIPMRGPNYTYAIDELSKRMPGLQTSSSRFGLDAAPTSNKLTEFIRKADCLVS